jgi:CSLREA domain-containing protein
MHLPRTLARTRGLKFYSAILLFLISGAAYSSRAGTFIVTSVADPGDGTCTAAEIGDGCTLREAINAANAVAGADTIDATGVSGTIGLTTALPDLSSDITILGPGPTVLRVSRSATARFRIFTILSSVTANISGVTITGGWTADGMDGTQVGGPGEAGGGIFNSGTLTLTDCTISGNLTGKGGAGSYGPGGSGGGIYNDGTLTIIASTVSSNRSGNGGPGRPGGGGGFRGGPGGLGAGIYSRGTATLINTTVSGNRSGDGGPASFDQSGGPGPGGGIGNSGTLTVSNCTISGNETGSGSFGSPGNRPGGGGVYSNGQTTISNSTIAFNGTQNEGGGIYRSDYGGTVTLRSSIIASNNVGSGGPDIAGTVRSDGYNLIGFQQGATISPNPGAGPDAYGPANLNALANNGGPTLTHLPRSDSPAIDKGKNFAATNTDQRGVGFSRVVDQPDSTYPNAADGTDVGAVELAPLFTPTPTATPTATATATPSPTAPPLVARNISTRARIETGDNVMIAGFTIRGVSLPKKLVIRGLGPSLEDMGVVGVVADPVLELRGSDGALIFGNDDWQDNSEQAAQIQAAGLAPTRSQESAIEVTLVPGSYTAIVRGKNNTSGIGLAEVYDIDNSESELANISTRALVAGDNGAVIAGFILDGGQPATHIAIRGLGPSLGQYGINNPLPDPTLELHDSNGAVLIVDDGWQDDPASAAHLAANGLALSNMKESGIYTSLPAGQYTAILAGKNGGVGIGVIEVYNLK